MRLGFVISISLLFFIVPCSGHCFTVSPGSGIDISSGYGAEVPSPDIPSDIREIQESGVLRIGIMEITAPPFVIERDGILTGYDVEICRDMAHTLGVEPEFHKIPGGYDKLIEAVAAGELDIAMCEISKTADRARSVFFSRVYFVSEVVIAANRLTLARALSGNTTQATDVEKALAYFDNPQFTVSTMAESALVPLAVKMFPQARKDLTMSWNVSASKIYRGEADIALLAQSAFEIAVHTNPELLYKVKELPLGFDDPLAIAVWPGRPDLLRWINDFLEANILEHKRTTQELIAEYMDVGESGTAKEENVQSRPESAETDGGSVPLAIGLHLGVFGLLWWRLIRRQNERHWLLSPWTVLAAMFLGGFMGVGFPALSSYFSRPAEVYMGFWRMCVLPIMLAAIITSIFRLLNGGDNSVLVKRLLVVTPLFLLLAAMLGVGVGATVKPGVDFPLEAQEMLVSSIQPDAEREQVSKGLYDQLMDMAGNIVPDNVLSPMVDNRSLAVLFIAVFFGVAVALGEKRGKITVVEIMDSVLEAFTTMIHASLYLLPFALYALALDFTARTGLELLQAVMRLVASLVPVMTVGAVFTFIIMRWRLKIPITRIFQDFGPLFLLSFSARSSVISMPIGLEALERCKGINRNQAAAAFPFALLVCHFTLAVFFAMTPIFIGQVFEVAFTLPQYLAIAILAIMSTVAAIGTIGLSYVFLLSIVCEPLGLPLEPAVMVGLAVVSLLGPLMAGIQALFGCGVTTLLVQKSEAPEPEPMPVGAPAQS